MTSRKPNRAETKRRMAAEKQRMQALQEQAPHLEPEFERILTRFTPRNVNSDRWQEDVGDFVRDVMRRSKVRGKATFPQLLSELSLYVNWAVTHGYDLNLDEILRHDRIDEWIDTAHDECSESTRSNRRSRLRNLATYVAPGLNAPRRPPAIGRPVVQSPYTLNEVAAITRLVHNQPSKIKRRQLTVMVAAGLGAGASASDLKVLRGRDVWRDETGVWWVALSSPTRTVPVRSDYAEMLGEATSGMPADALFIGTNPERKAAVSWVIEGAAITEDHPDLNQARLRSTWLMNLMSQPVPLSVILQVAGLSSGRTLVDLLPFCQDHDYVTNPVGGDVNAVRK